MCWPLKPQTVCRKLTKVRRRLFDDVKMDGKILMRECKNVSVAELAANRAQG
jgi:hypothetical protein